MAGSAAQSRLLLVITRGTVGGAQRVVADLARELHQRGEDVTVAFGEGDFLMDVCNQTGIPHHRLASLQRNLNPFSNLRVIFETRKLVDRERFDVVHVHSSNALFAAVGAKLARRKPKTVFTFHGLSFLDRGARVSALKRVVVTVAYRVLLRWVDENVFVSKKNYQTALQRGLVREGVVVPNGIDMNATTFLERQQARAELEKMAGESFDGAFLAGSIGRLDMPKNYEFLIRAASELRTQLPQLRFIIIGEGPERAKLERSITEHRVADRIYLLGEQKEASRYLRAFDAFVLPSIYEGWSLSILEAMAAGVPVLASDVGAAREQLGDALEQLFPPHNLKAFSDRLQELAADRNLRNWLGNANQERVQLFTLRACVGEYQVLYRA